MTEEEYYAVIKAEYEASTDAKLVKWARPYFEGTKKPDSKDRYIVCPVSDRAAQDIYELTGSDVKGFNHVLRCDEVAHINKRHGKHGKADNSMRDIADLGRLAYVLKNYDEIIFNDRISDGFRNKIGKHALSVLFVKRVNGHVYAAEAITDSTKKKELHIETMYKARTSNYLAQKRESVVDDKNPRPNVLNASDSTSISILPQSKKNVKPSSENNSDLREERQRTVANGRAKIAAEMAEIKAKLRGKSPSEIAEMSRRARQKNKQNGNNSSGSGGKPSNGNGSDGNSGR